MTTVIQERLGAGSSLSNLHSKKIGSTGTLGVGETFTVIGGSNYIYRVMINYAGPGMVALLDSAGNVVCAGPGGANLTLAAGQYHFAVTQFAGVQDAASGLYPYPKNVGCSIFSLPAVAGT